MLDKEKYKFTDGGTALSAAELNKRFYALVARIHELEEVKANWESAVSTLQNLGLTKITEYIQPLIEDANARIQAVDTEAQAWAGVAEDWAGQAQETVAEGIGPHDADTAAHPAIRGAVAQVASDLGAHAADAGLHQDAAGAIAGHDGEASAHAAAIAQHNGGTAAHAAAIAAQRPWATAGEAVAGAAVNKVMSPARVAAAIAALTPTPDVAGQINDRLDDVMLVSHTVPIGADGGAFTAGAWRTRDLTAVEINNITGAILNSNVITLPPGMYYALWHGVVTGVWRHCTRFYNITTAKGFLGLPSYAQVTDIAVGHAVFEITGTCQFRLEHVCYQTSSTGFGSASGLDIPARLADVFIKKME